MEPHKLTGALR